MTHAPIPPSSTLNDDDARYALFREGSTAEPGLDLDARILAAANAELSPARATSHRPSPWWRRWLPVTSAITVSVVGVSVALRMLHEDEARQAAMLGVTANEASVAAMGEAAEISAPTAPAPLSDAAVSPPGNVKESAKKSAAKSAAAPPAVARPAPAPVQKKAMSADSAKAERALGAGLPAAPAPMADESAIARSAPAVNANAPSAKMTESRLAEPDGAADPATPQAWIAELRRLQTAGHLAEARQSLKRFRARFPGEVLPDDLIGLQ